MAPVDDDDLYGDLDTNLKKARPDNERKRRLSSNAEGGSNGGGHAVGSNLGTTQLELEYVSMRERIRILEEENSRLRRNIGTLFRTAKNEIQRKDEHINRLQQQLQQQES